MSKKKGYKIDKKVWEALKKKIDFKHTISAGVNERDNVSYPDNPDSMTADVALYNEFGTSKMPARSFIREGVKDDSIKEMFAKGATLIIEKNETESSILHSISPYVEQQMRNRIRTKNIYDTGLLTTSTSAIVKKKE